jgi:flagellar motor switch protein FliM
MDDSEENNNEEEKKEEESSASESSELPADEKELADAWGSALEESGDTKKDLSEEEMLAQWQNTLASDESGAVSQLDVDKLFRDSDSVVEEKGLQALVQKQIIKTERFPMLDVVMDKFHQYASLTLRNFFQVNIEARILNIRTQTFGDYLDSVALPATFNVFNFEQWESSGLMMVDSSMVNALINILFGGKKFGKIKKERFEGRPFSQLEMNLTSRFVSTLLTDLSNAFSFIHPMSFKMERQETFPKLVGISANNNPTIVCSLSIDVGEIFSGNVDLAIPHISLDPIRDELLKKHAGDSFGQPNVWKPYLTQELLETSINMDAVLLEQFFTLSDVLNWKVGTVIPVESIQMDNIVLRCDNFPIVKGKLGQKNEHLSVEIDDVYLKEKRLFGYIKN